MQTPDTAAQPQLLLVDDDRLILATLSEGLAHSGFQVRTAESAEEAEALLSSGLKPDLAILDFRLAGRDGLSLAQRLHQLDHIPFIMLSAFSDPATVEQATRSGALGYLVKPLDLPQLVPAIQAALTRANELQELRTTRVQLQSALGAERDISIAIGITMMQHHLNRRDAFELLRSTARKRSWKLADLALEVIQDQEALKQ